MFIAQKSCIITDYTWIMIGEGEMGQNNKLNTMLFGGCSAVSKNLKEERSLCV